MIYAHLFENPGAGIGRNLFWNLSLNLQGDDGAGQDHAVRSVACDWLTFSVRDWSKLDGVSLSDCQRPELIECSFYRGSEHCLADLDALRFSASTGVGLFKVNVSLHAPPATDGGLAVNLKLECEARFDGIIVVPGNLSPPPATPEDAALAVAAFADVPSLRAPVWDRFRYVFKPIGQG